MKTLKRKLIINFEIKYDDENNKIVTLDENDTDIDQNEPVIDARQIALELLNSLIREHEIIAMDNGESEINLEIDSSIENYVVSAIKENNGIDITGEYLPDDTYTDIVSSVLISTAVTELEEL
jgi:hypothetical protein